VTCLGLTCLLVRDAGRRLPVGVMGNGAFAPSALLLSKTLTLLTRRISERDFILAISQQLALDVHQRVEQMAGQLPPDEGGHQSSSVAISRNQRVEQMAGQLPPLRSNQGAIKGNQGAIHVQSRCNQFSIKVQSRLPPLRRKVKGMLVAERPVELTL
jgi:hypothetical protein